MSGSARWFRRRSRGQRRHALFERVAQRHGRLDFFLSNAAASAFKRIVDLNVRNLDRTFALNVRAFVLGAIRALPLMKNGGRIVALSSYGSARAAGRWRRWRRPWRSCSPPRRNTSPARRSPSTAACR